MSEAMRFYGKYRGVVTNNQDPTLRGRVMVNVPAVTGSHDQWAMPCAPYAGPGVGFFAVPPVGANVWVEFEGGDPDAAILAGCFWGPGEAPVVGLQQFVKAFVTDSFALTMDEAKGSVSLDIKLGAAPILSVVVDAKGLSVASQPGSLTMTSTGVEIAFGQSASIELKATGVAVNKDAFEVLP